MYHFFVERDNLTEDIVRITGADYNHMKNVIRLKAREKVLISIKDALMGEADRWSFLCEVSSYTENEAVLNIIERTSAYSELPCRVTLFQGLPKSDKMELIIQKAVELGAYEIVPVKMKRCIVKLDDRKADVKTARWNAISESAAKQSKRLIIPKVRDIVTFKEAVDEAEGYDIGLVPYENEAGMSAVRNILGSIQTGSRIAVFIGPEGGFEEDEIEYARAHGMKTITLGKRILRTETAGMAFLAMLAYALEE